MGADCGCGGTCPVCSMGRTVKISEFLQQKPPTTIDKAGKVTLTVQRTGQSSFTIGGEGASIDDCIIISIEGGVLPELKYRKNPAEFSSEEYKKIHQVGETIGEDAVAELKKKGVNVKWLPQK